MCVQQGDGKETRKTEQKKRVHIANYNRREHSMLVNTYLRFGMVSCHKKKTDGQTVPQHPGMHALSLFRLCFVPSCTYPAKRSASRKCFSQVPEAAEIMHGRMMYIIR